MVKENWRDEDNKIVENHFNQLMKMKDDGVVILAGRTLNDERSAFGIVIFNAKDDEDAKRIMESDPAIMEGIMSGELFPYHVALISEKNAL
jgi:uncharacterized protein YciI